MAQKIILKGIAWDHPRGYEPLRATSEVFEKKYPKVRIEWDIRSLKEFGDMPIEDLIGRYDLLTIDHPYMGQAHENKLLLSLEDRLLAPYLDKLSKASIGPSFSSYFYEDKLYALPIDAAALVAAARSDLLEQFKLTLPTYRADLFDFYKKIPSPYRVAWPLCATDLWCAFLSLGTQDAGKGFIHNYKIEEKTGAIILDELKRHLDFIHPESIHWNPIQLLDQMAANDEIIYAPFLFGYTNYARRNYAKKIIHFSNSPSNPATNISTIMGGVGLAVSTQCQYPAWALAYLAYVADPKTQRTIYTQFGGQAATKTAWEDAINNKLCHNFFKDTLATMENVYVRPQHPAWNIFQEEGAALLHRGLMEDRSSEILMKELNALYQTIEYAI
ncbi:MAG: ABC transporter substrate-binding protein [Saprospiraceae bacterium]